MQDKYLLIIKIRADVSVMTDPMMWIQHVLEGASSNSTPVNNAQEYVV